MYVANGVPRPYNEDASYYDIRRGSLYSRNDYASGTSTDEESRTHNRRPTFFINENEYCDQFD